MDRTDGARSCSITVHLNQTAKASGAGVVLEACLVGSVNRSDGSIVLNWDLGELNSTRESVSTEQVTKKLSGMLFQEGLGKTKNSEAGAGYEVKRERTVTGQDGTGVFQDLDEGAWLIHAVDSTSYGRIEDILTAVPCFVPENGSWMGPVYDTQVWPKAMITSTSPEEVPETIPAQEKTEPVRESPAQKETKTKDPGPKTFETEHEREEKPEKPVRTTAEAGKSPAAPSVRTLDDTPLSALICMFLTCALFIGIVMIRIGKRYQKPGSRLMLLAAASGLLLSAGCVTLIRAEEAAGTDEISQMLEGERKIVFVNEASKVPCLTVSKEVLSAENGSRAPAGDRFTFRLYVNHERASGLRYRVFNEEGVELAALSAEAPDDLVPLSGAAGDPVPLKCKRDGSFTLQGGQYALFEDVTPGDLWEVTELSSEHYERLEPVSSGTLSGTITKEGNSARFVNRYDPGEDPGYTEGTLEIKKHILWPEGIALPSRGSFFVRVLVDGAPWKQAQVELSDLSGSSSVRRVLTDDNGIFPIPGDTKAVLKSIPLGADLFVEEIDEPEDAFVPSGSISWKGASGPHVKVAFTNRLADFMVEKTVHPASDQGRFLFCLVDGSDHPRSHVPYYIAKADGTLDNAAPFYTDAEGHFTLSGAERAVFTGLREGEQYGVREERILGYRQTIPASPAGYSGQQVNQGVPSLQFENEKTTIRMSLPSAGGRGLAYILVLAASGMSACLIVLRKEGKGQERKGGSYR